MLNFALPFAVGARSIPHWLRILLGEKFFDPCVVHQSVKKNEKNILCLNCCVTICQHCLPFHRPHRRLQIRRYVYQDVIRLSDAQKLINCSLVQPYTTNSAKVVFLNERPMSRPFRGSGNFCIKCDRSLQDPFLYCSLSCKVKHLETATATATATANAKHVGKELDQHSQLLALACFEEEPQMTPDSVLDSLVSPNTCSGGSTNTTATSNIAIAANCKPSSLLACTEFVTKKNKKKRSRILMSGNSSCRSRCLQSQAFAADSISRRKSVPHRSPLN